MNKFSKEITPEIEEILKQGTSDGNIYYLPRTQLERKTYVEVNTALENLGGTWNRAKKGHIFDSPPMEKINNALEVGETVNEKKKDNFFETPKELVNRMIELSDTKYFDGAILEPSAGEGAIIDTIRESGLTNYVYAVEINEERLDKIKAEGVEKRLGDFLTMKPKNFEGFKIARVIMNPPFAVEGRPQSDIDHVLHAYKFLKDGGRLVAIMSSGWTNRQNKKSTDFKKLVEENGFYEENDKNAFKKSGTLVSTVIVVLNK